MRNQEKVAKPPHLAQTGWCGQELFDHTTPSAVTWLRNFFLIAHPPLLLLRRGAAAAFEASPKSRQFCIADPTPPSSPLRQRVDPVLARTRCRYGRVRCKTRLCKITIPTCRDRDVLASVHFIHCGYSFRSGREIEFPENLPVVLIVGAQLPIRRTARDNEPARSHDNTAAWSNAANALTGIA